MIKAIAIFLVLGSVCADIPGIWLDKPVLDFKIIKGEDANEGEFPFLVSLRRRAGGSHACGGSILTKNWALTAAHCCAVGNENTLYLVSGTIYRTRGGVEHPLKRLLKHQDYAPNQNWRNDMCLIEVAKPFQYSDNVKQVTLPPQDWQINQGDKIVAMGWGFTTPNKPQKAPERLQKASTFIALSNEQCGKTTGIPMSPAHICVRGGVHGQGICQGDSGSPITKDGVQVGVASWVFLPCGSGMPDFYARVPTYINWIKEQLGSEAAELQFHK